MMGAHVEQLAWTWFVDRHAYAKKDVQHTWPELIEHIRHAGPYPTKHHCPLLKLAVFGDRATTKGSLRHDANVVRIVGVEGDYDGEQMQPEEAIQRLEAAQVRACVYTSPTHKPDAPRWRVIAPLNEPTNPANRARLLARINGVLGGVLSSESFTLSQSYYYGRVNGADYRVLVTFDDAEDGECVDTLDGLDQIAMLPQRPDRTEDGTGGDIAAKVEALGRRLRTGDGRREVLKSYIGKRLQMGLSSDEVRTLLDDAVLRFFDPSDPVDWSDIKKMVADFAAADHAEAQRVESVVGEFVKRAASQAIEKAAYKYKLRRSDLAFDKLDAINWILHGFVASGEIICFAGQPGAGKSTAFGGVALVVAGFGHLIGSDIQNDRPRKVLIVTEHAQQYARLFYAYINEFGLDAKAVMDQVVLFDSARMTVEEIKEEILHMIEAGKGEERPLIVLDTASACFSLQEENSNSEVGAVIAEINTAVRSTGAPVWIITHAAKSVSREDSEITPRGAGAWMGDVQGTGSVFRDKNFPDSVFIKSLKNRAVPDFKEIEVLTRVIRYEVADERGVIQSIGIRIGVPMASKENQRILASQRVKEAEKAAHDFAKDVERRGKVQAAIDAGMPSAKKAYGWIKEHQGGMDYSACVRLFGEMKRAALDANVTG